MGTFDSPVLPSGEPIIFASTTVPRSGSHVLRLFQWTMKIRILLVIPPADIVEPQDHPDWLATPRLLAPTMFLKC